MPISNISTYHRPPDLPSALRLLREGGEKTVPLAGGTDLVGIPPRAVEEVVDLAGLGLDGINARETGGLSLGAAVTLSALVEEPALREYAGGALATAARYEAGNLVRNRATLGGTVVARAARSDLVALLLALAAQVTLFRGEEPETVPLAAWYEARAGRQPAAGPEALIVEVQLPALPADARVRMERIARTPMDIPILTVAAVRAGEGARAAASGLGDTSRVLIDEASLEQTEEALAGAITRALSTLDVQGNHLASESYRRAMLPVLLRRVLGKDEAEDDR